MQIDSKTGLLSAAQYFASPNQDERPEKEKVSLLVIHNISLPPDQFSGDDVKDFFLNQLNIAKHSYYQTIGHLKVSSHLWIRRTGEVLQFVPFHRRAWHAGASDFQGKKECNDFSIGIELEGTDKIPFTEIQYAQLVACTHAIMQAYPAITPHRGGGHEDIAPGRKSDPGPLFDWSRYRAQMLMPKASV
uniref:1,6-anhydro-N-acetylmuramyl-L-alanine amidase AmpD n=1 Tax=Candidatus Berkiella cookevillensis TaxID=437022 RepID=A0A0Q9YPE5_9GAMM